MNQPAPASSPSASADELRVLLRVDLTALLAWLHQVMGPERWSAVSSAMSLLSGQSLLERCRLICAAVVDLPDPELETLAALFAELAGDLAGGRPHRTLTAAESDALQALRAVLAAA
jgi:hypothetical protein